MPPKRHGIGNNLIEGKECLDCPFFKIKKYISRAEHAIRE